MVAPDKRRQAPPFFLLPILWEKVARSAKTVEGVLAEALLVPSWNTPHPTSLREATFSHKGRRKSPRETITFTAHSRC
ncbi:hypothetical protein [Mesorhizobium sp.]|uniref:hypothetical protein n=1 Tax=Mesorhizobium sp. TaxID=1871066 RepID=UPI000FE7C9D5|nr:hypothetical protein [Mesorhizobium sp.]RWO87643.1 MAG: hypothetical protein EOQ95_19680 [Mesorhizobium sp.]RWQ50906.1 MAG: hypothetical protein EOS84_20955 [Mesorhizobium sp.]